MKDRVYTDGSGSIPSTPCIRNKVKDPLVWLQNLTKQNKKKARMPEP